MKIIKMYQSKDGYCYVMFDEIPKMTYEKVDRDYIGSVIDDEGNIIFSEFLKYESGSWCHAFAGRELSLSMKDGSIQKIKDHWFDCGSCKQHGEFIGIGASTLERLQECYVYCSYNINKQTFDKMVEDYFTRDKLYEYYEIEDWCKLQYDWYQLKISGNELPFMMNKKGDVIEKETKQRVHCMNNYCKLKGDKSFSLCIFRLKYYDGDRLLKIEKKYSDVIKETITGKPVIINGQF